MGRRRNLPRRGVGDGCSLMGFSFYITLRLMVMKVSGRVPTYAVGRMNVNIAGRINLVVKPGDGL